MKARKPQLQHGKNVTSENRKEMLKTEYVVCKKIMGRAYGRREDDSRYTESNHDSDRDGINVLRVGRYEHECALSAAGRSIQAKEGGEASMISKEDTMANEKEHRDRQESMKAEDWYIDIFIAKD